MEMSRKRIVAWGIVLVMGSTGCSCKNYRPEILQMVRTIKMNSCIIDKIRSRTDSVWTKTLYEVIPMLPEDIPSKERETIITLKNADLLRKVYSYARLGDKVYAKIDAMEVYDIEMADSIRGLSFQNQELEMEVEKLLTKLEAREPVEKIRSEINAIKSEKCL